MPDHQLPAIPTSHTLNAFPQLPPMHTNNGWKQQACALPLYKINIEKAHELPGWLSEPQRDPHPLYPKEPMEDAALLP